MPKRDSASVNIQSGRAGSVIGIGRYLPSVIQNVRQYYRYLITYINLLERRLSLNFYLSYQIQKRLIMERDSQLESEKAVRYVGTARIQLQ